MSKPRARRMKPRAPRALFPPPERGRNKVEVAQPRDAGSFFKCSNAARRSGEAGQRINAALVLVHSLRSLKMAARLMILNGPNLNLLGVREPHIYGSTTLAAIEASCREFAQFLGASLEFHQSNHEGTLVDLIQSARISADALIMNPAGYS